MIWIILFLKLFLILAKTTVVFGCGASAVVALIAWSSYVQGSVPYLTNTKELVALNQAWWFNVAVKSTGIAIVLWPFALYFR